MIEGIQHTKKWIIREQIIPADKDNDDDDDDDDDNHTYENNIKTEG